MQILGAWVLGGRGRWKMGWGWGGWLDSRGVEGVVVSKRAEEGFVWQDKVDRMGCGWKGVVMKMRKKCKIDKTFGGHAEEEGNSVIGRTSQGRWKGKAVEGNGRNGGA